MRIHSLEHHARKILNHAALIRNIKRERHRKHNAKRLHVAKRDHASEFAANENATARDIVAVVLVTCSLAATAFKIESMLHLNSDVIYSVTTTAIAHPMVRWIRHHVI